jgi:hypothetical protein
MLTVFSRAIAGISFSAEAQAATRKEPSKKEAAESGAGDCYPICKAGAKANGDAEFAKMMALIEARNKEAVST